MKVYTKTGDGGETGLYGGGRVSKNSELMHAIGDLDELNAAIGLAACGGANESYSELLREIQCRLFDIGGELASSGRGIPCVVSSQDIAALEASIDEMWGALPALRAFILPGGGESSARLHLARAICRRAERSMIALHEAQPVREEPRVYLNRLSDWLFAAARTANACQNVSEIEWRSKPSES